MNAAKAKIDEGIDLVKERQKLIKLADTSELGWKVVQEYVANPIADDSEDEKRMNRAQARAERKSKAEKSKKTKNRTAPYNSSSEKKDEKLKIRSGRCFTCGRRGHWADSCPESASKTTKLSRLDLSYFVQNSLKSSENISILSEHKSRDNSITDFSPFKVTHYHISDIDLSRQTNNGISNSIITPVGRLKANINKWKLITSNIHVIDVVQNGYKLPLKTEPDRVILQNNRSALDNPDFVKSEIESLLKKGCIREVVSPPKVVNPLTVAYNKKAKPRLVLDCRHINPHLFQFRFKYEDAYVAKEMFRKGDYLFGYDLKSAYHHIDIFEEHRQFLGFSWNYKGKIKYFVYNVLAFGIATAGFIFSKVTREVVKHFRTLGIKIIMYLDDGLGGCS